MEGADQPEISSSYKRYIVSANHRHRRPYPTNRTGDLDGTTCGSGPNDPQTAKHDKPEIAPVFLPSVPVIKVENYRSSSSSTPLRSCPLTNYSGGATKIVALGTMT